MTGGLPRGISGKQAVAALERAGWQPVRTKGDHQILKHPAPREDAYATVAVPLHRELAIGTLAGILRRIGMTADELRQRPSDQGGKVVELRGLEPRTCCLQSSRSTT